LGVGARQQPFPRLKLAFGRLCVLTASTHLGPRSAGILWYRLPASPVEVQDVVDHGKDAPSRRKGDLFDQEHQPSRPEPPERR
jgi:hypothetical protein